MITSQSRYSKCLYFASNALARKIEKQAQESFKPVGLSPSHGYLLMLVVEGPGVQPGTLAGQLQLQPSTITRLIEKLEKKKLAVRIKEGKSTSVYPTPKARELYGRLNDCMNHFNTSISVILDNEDSIRMVNNMNKLADKMKG